MSQLPAQLPRNRRTDAFERRVAANLEVTPSSGEPVVVACSGGPDSVATLIATCRVLTPAQVTTAHFDHRIRPSAETEADAAFVEVLAGYLGTRVALGHAESPLAGDEASAREARYAWLASVLREVGARAAVTGHTRDDQAETVLLNLARGGGLRAARGMARSSVWPLPAPGSEGLRVLRPLLSIARAEVESYLETLGIEARIDSTNKQAGYARNRVRHQAMPALEAVNTEVRAHLAAFADRAREADAALDEWAARECETHGETSGACARFPRRRLGELPAAVAKGVVTLMATRVGLELNATQREGLVAIAARRGARLDLGGGLGRTDSEWLQIIAGSGR